MVCHAKKKIYDEIHVFVSWTSKRERNQRNKESKK